MTITVKDEELIEGGFIDAFNLPEGPEMADKALTAWRTLWNLMMREDNFSNNLGSQILDWQIGNWAQDVTMVLHNVQRYQDVIDVNEQILKINWGSHLENFHENAKRDIADSYADMGDMQKSYELYKKYLDEDPLWGWAWIGFFRLLYNSKSPEFEIILDELYQKVINGVAFRDMEDLCRELGDEFNKLGQVDKAKVCSERSRKAAMKSGTSHYLSGIISHDLLEPVAKAKKIYPNDLCPCGSGKKYKKCCGRA